MSTTDTTTETAPVETQEQAAVETPDPTTSTEEAPPSGREAAKYRTRLREAEAERDTMREQLAAIRRQVVEEASGLVQPAGLWAAGVHADEMFDDQGRLDPDRLTAAVTGAAESLGLTRAPRTPKPDPSQGSHGTSIPAAPDWGSALRPQAVR